MTSQSANKLRIESPLHEGVALGMVLGARHAQFPESLFDRIHHHIWSAYEIFMIGIGRRHMTPKHLSGYEALFPPPPRRGILQRVETCQNET